MSWRPGTGVRLQTWKLSAKPRERFSDGRCAHPQPVAQAADVEGSGAEKSFEYLALEAPVGALGRGEIRRHPASSTPDRRLVLAALARPAPTTVQRFARFIEIRRSLASHLSSVRHRSGDANGFLVS